MNTSQSRLLRIVGVAGLIVGPASLIVATVLQWILQSLEPTATVFQAIAAHGSLWSIVGLISVFGPLVWLAGIPATIGLARGRGWVLTTTGGYLTAVGLAAAIGHLALYFGEYAVLATDGVGDRARELLARAADAEMLGNVLLVLFLIAFSLGPILLTIGLRRAAVVPVWVPVAAIVGTVANFVGGVPAGIVQLVALVVTFAPIIVALVRASGGDTEPVSTLEPVASRGNGSDRIRP